MNEDAIIKGCLRGKADCQRALVMQYSGMLMTVARRYARDDHAAKDILQEAFIRIFKAIGQYEHKGVFAAWLRRITVNAALQQADRSAYHKEQYILEDQAHPLVSPEALQALQAEDLIKMVQCLPEGFRVVFNLYAMDGYSHDEIAEMLGIAPGTSRARLTRARQFLQNMILTQEKEYYAQRVG
jgi:RNA polymerase sigma factor (sigma-70 family)